MTGNFQGTGNCNNGRHEIKSTSPSASPCGAGARRRRASMIKGFYTQYVSYAYPAGAGVAPINTVVIPPVAQ